VIHRCARFVPAPVALAVLLGCAVATRGQDTGAPRSGSAPSSSEAAPSSQRARQDAAEDAPLDLGETRPKNGRATPDSPGRYLLRALLSLAIVVALIYALFFGARLWRRARAVRGPGATAIEVLDTANLDADKTVYVVALGPKTIVLGGSGTELRFICELSEAEAAAFRTSVERTAARDGADR